MKDGVSPPLCLHERLGPRTLGAAAGHRAVLGSQDPSEGARQGHLRHLTGLSDCE